MVYERETENKNYFAGTKNVVAKVKCSVEGLKHKVGGGFLKIIEQGGPVVHRGHRFSLLWEDSTCWEATKPMCCNY